MPYTTTTTQMNPSDPITTAKTLESTKIAISIPLPSQPSPLSSFKHLHLKLGLNRTRVLGRLPV